jgi:hypothetical protein
VRSTATHYGSSLGWAPGCVLAAAAAHLLKVMNCVQDAELHRMMVIPRHLLALFPWPWGSAIGLGLSC